MKAKREIMPAVRKNREREKACSTYDPSLYTTRWCVCGGVGGGYGGGKGRVYGGGKGRVYGGGGKGRVYGGGGGRGGYTEGEECREG